MNAEQINAKIYAGRAKAALRLGLDYNVFRPVSAANPMTNQVATIKAAFNAGDNNYKSPNMPGDAFWHGDFDGRGTQAGDYLVHPISPFDVKFIAAQQMLLPIVCIECNRIISVSRASPQTSIGAVGYSGLQELGMDVVLSEWPCSILMSGNGRKAAGLPAGVSDGSWRVLLPPSVPAEIKAGDIVTDDIGRRYAIEAAELTDLGWRINALEVHL